MAKSSRRRQQDRARVETRHAAEARERERAAAERQADRLLDRAIDPALAPAALAGLAREPGNDPATLARYQAGAKAEFLARRGLPAWVARARLRAKIERRAIPFD